MRKETEKMARDAKPTTW